MYVNLLIADSHPIYRAGLCSALQSLNVINSIDEASSENDVLNLLKDKVYDIIILEIAMPEMNGIEISRIINKSYPQTRIIALSMKSDISTITQMITFGAYGYLLKTSEVSEVQNAVNLVYSGKKYFSKDVTAAIIDTLTAQRFMQEDKQLKENDRIRDVLFLMCHELSNIEIADLMFLSPRTIEYYRKKLAEVTHSRNYVGVTKYGIKSGILNDENLCNKWSDKINQLSNCFEK